MTESFQLIPRLFFPNPFSTHTLHPNNKPNPQSNQYETTSSHHIHPSPQMRSSQGSTTAQFWSIMLIVIATIAILTTASRLHTASTTTATNPLPLSTTPLRSASLRLKSHNNIGIQSLQQSDIQLKKTKIVKYTRLYPTLFIHGIIR